MAGTEHRIRWFARLPGTSEDWTPRTRVMRGAWGWDVRCSCGWETRTGGATERSLRAEVWQHKFFAVASEEQAEAAPGEPNGQASVSAPAPGSGPSDDADFDADVEHPTWCGVNGEDDGCTCLASEAGATGSVER